jgi:hypothetical protein
VVPNLSFTPFSASLAPALVSFVSSEEAVVSSAGASVAAAVVSAGAEDCPHPAIAIAAKAIIAVAVITFFS